MIDTPPRSAQAAVRDPNVVCFLENELMYGVSFPLTAEELSEDFVLPIGKAKVEKEGTDVTIVAHSKMVTHSLEAAEILEKEEGIKVEVVNLRWVAAKRGLSNQLIKWMWDQVDPSLGH